MQLTLRRTLVRSYQSSAKNNSPFMIYEIHNDQLAVAVTTKGAELQSIINKENGLEYLWTGDAKFWSKKSPVLFPVVGGLKNEQYKFKEKPYQLNRHGFAREMEFEMIDKKEDLIVFLLKANEETLKKYPFQFSFFITYSLQNNELITTYKVENNGTGKMYFSVGAHPAFKVPLVNDTSFEDYFLLFETFENADRWPLSAEGLIETNATPFFNNQEKIKLTKELFYKDALVFKNLKSKTISIISDKTNFGIKVSYNNFPFMGIWSAKDADFVCIEPWCGIADSVNATGNIEEKEGINSIEHYESFERNWHALFF